MAAPMEIKIPTDSDGFTTLSCPICTRGFKVRPASANPFRRCPYCAHSGNDSSDFFGNELREYVRVQGENATLELLKKGATLKKSLTARPSPLPPAPNEPESAGMASTVFACCSEELRHDGKSAELYCPSCGTKQSA